MLLLILVLQRLFVPNLASNGLNTNGLWTNGELVSAIGDPAMRNINVRVALEAWNFCNEVGFEAPGMGSPRLADCADFFCYPVSNGTFFKFIIIIIILINWFSVSINIRNFSVF